MRARHRRRTVAGLAAAALGVLVAVPVPATPAAAHNTLRTADPARDARLTTAPRAITLAFTEPLKPAFTTVILADQAGQPIPAGELTVVGATATLPVDGPLANGGYTVAYRVVSADGHPVQGSYRFTVADPAAPPAPAGSPPATTPPAGTGAQPYDGDGPGALVAAGGVLAGGVLATATALVLARRRRHR